MEIRYFHRLRVVLRPEELNSGCAVGNGKKAVIND